MALAITPLCAVYAEPQFSGDAWNSPELLFKAESHNKNGYRIPAIVKTSQGTLIALTDFRTQPGLDIGWNGSDPNLHIDYAYKVSYDNGNTWTEEKRFTPTGIGKDQISDAALLHDPVTGKTFAFGLYAGDKLGSPGVQDKNDFVMFESDDGGLTWDKGVSIKDKVLPNDSKVVFQGPGTGMYYDNTLYMPVQAWWQSGNLQNPYAGIMFSTDHGKNWETAWLPVDPTTGKRPSTSEANVFHHKGYVYLAAKPDMSNSETKRQVWRTNDNGKTWEKVDEWFVPDDIVKCETSSLALSEDVYLVAYAATNKDATHPNPRNDIYITTSTGKKILVAEGDTMGYTSMTMDDDNLYLFFEGGEKVGNMWFQRYDLASKEYANLPLQFTNRASDAMYMQDILKGDKSYIKGSYGLHDDNGFEALFVRDKYKVGMFYKNEHNLSDDIARTIAYDSEDLSLLVGVNDVLIDNDNFIVGVQQSKIDYKNNSENEALSAMAGWSFDVKIKDIATYNFALMGVLTSNDIDRNHKEGISRTANFNSYSVSLKNSLSNDYKLFDVADLNVETGLYTTFFGNSEFTEEGGNGWNNATVAKASNTSNELFIKATSEKTFNLSSAFDARIYATGEYKYQLEDYDDWKEEFTVLDVTKKMAKPVSYDKHYVKADIGVDFTYLKAATLGISASFDNDDENTVLGSLKYQF